MIIAFYRISHDLYAVSFRDANSLPCDRRDCSIASPLATLRQKLPKVLGQDQRVAQEAYALEAS